MLTVLLIGNGAREHCIAEALTKSGKVTLASYAKAKNPGIYALSEIYQIGSYTDFSAILEFVKKVKPDFAVIGPDDPISDGVADLLLELKIQPVAPLKTVARLESSKSFTRNLLKKYAIEGNPKFEVFYDKKGIKEFLDSLGGNFVVKADGLMGGKGVKVSGDHLADAAEGEKYAIECINKSGKVVIEEKLIGQEFSLMSFVDGQHVSDMIPVQDHKRAFVGDEGPNTGGMGSYSDKDHLLPFLEKSDLEQAHAITEKVAHALFEETGVLYKGIIYGGFIAVKDGIRVIEYNARFGDPEVMNALPIMKTDFVEVCQAILDSRLDRLNIEFASKATVCKYVVPEGYPDNPSAGKKIIVAPESQSSDLKMYFSSVDQREDGLYLSGSRAIAFVGIGDTLSEAEKLAENACQSVNGPVFHREDVGTKALIEHRIGMMRALRKR